MFGASSLRSPHTYTPTLSAQLGSDPNDFTFIVNPTPSLPKAKTYVLGARDKEDLDTWVEAIRAQLLQAPPFSK